MLEHQIKRFIVVGVITVLIDFLGYQTLLFIDVPTPAAKGIGFITGTVFAFFANRRWTFRSTVSGTKVLSTFFALYVTTLTVNVVINSGSIQLIGESQLAIFAAFLLATGTSASLNFLGMRYVVFHERTGGL